jgi:hypothetical protein
MKILDAWASKGTSLKIYLGYYYQYLNSWGNFQRGKSLNELKIKARPGMALLGLGWLQ